MDLDISMGLYIYIYIYICSDKINRMPYMYTHANMFVAVVVVWKSVNGHREFPICINISIEANMYSSTVLLSLPEVSYSCHNQPNLLPVAELMVIWQGIYPQSQKSWRPEVWNGWYRLTYLTFISLEHIRQSHHTPATWPNFVCKRCPHIQLGPILLTEIDF